MAETLGAEVRAVAAAAGLDRAMDRFPQDVAAAAAAARAATGALKVPDDPAAEPWPPMQVGSPA